MGTEQDIWIFEWNKLKEQWLKLVLESGRFKPVYGEVVALEDMTRRVNSPTIIAALSRMIVESYAKNDISS